MNTHKNKCLNSYTVLLFVTNITINTCILCISPLLKNTDLLPLLCINMSNYVPDTSIQLKNSTLAASQVI